MRLGFVVILITLSSFLAACGSSDEARNEATQENSNEPRVETIEVTREVTVERTVGLGNPDPESTEDEASLPGTVRSDTDVEGEVTRDALPGPALPADTDIERTVGETATLDNGNSVTVFSGQSGVPAPESVYKARPGMEFFVVEAEVCVPASATDASYFTPREFSLLRDGSVRRQAGVPTKLPALRGARVEPGECNRGYITFQVEEGEDPRAVAYEGSSVVEWDLRER